jgi:NAD(P)-dependent dehydrogenase (short-subunit alcohol dehydrogenase family)
MDLTGKTALVTGATRGIGESCARALDRAGARVVLSGRTEADLERVAGDLKNDPLVMLADLLPAGAGTELAERVIAATGGVDVLVNNAGIPMRRTPDRLSEADVDAVFSVNVRSLLMLSIGLAPSMIERGGGSIVNVSSIAGLRGPLGRVAYAGTKGAVDAMTRSLAADWGPDGIRVNSVAPGIITTAIWEKNRRTIPGLIEDLAAKVALKRWGDGDDVADVVLFLASDASRYVTGETIAVDGGMARVSSDASRPAKAPA